MAGKGIISGFIGGGAKGVAELGMLTFQNQMKGERDEANYLRDTELAKNKQAFTADENQKDRDSRQKIAKNKSSGGSKPTNKTKNINDLMSRGLSEKEAILKVYPSSKIDYTDKDGNQVVVVPDGKDANGSVKFKEIGRFVKDEKGTPTWLNKGEELENAEVTSKHRKKAKNLASDKAGVFSTDETDFPSTGGDRKLYVREESQRIANEERKSKKKGGGIVSGQMTKSGQMLPGGESIPQDTKKIKGRSVSKEEFTRRMIKQHGKDKAAEIEKAWNSIK